MFYYYCHFMLMHENLNYGMKIYFSIEVAFIKMIRKNSFVIKQYIDSYGCYLF
jgi:hypothetical protein